VDPWSSLAGETHTRRRGPRHLLRGVFGRIRSGRAGKRPALQGGPRPADKDRDGKLSKDEDHRSEGEEPLDEYLDLDRTAFSRNATGSSFERRRGENGLRAYRLKGRRSHRVQPAVEEPSLPSQRPVTARIQSVLCTLKEGGILTSFDMKSGEILKQQGSRVRPGLLRIAGRGGRKI